MKTFARSTLIALCLTTAMAVSAPAASAATPPITSYFNACPTYGTDQRICSGQVPSFDGSTLDVDLTLPNTTGSRHPLIVMLHGFGNNKHEWESTTTEGDGGDKLRWNSKFFADRGYYVLTYTARGFHDQGKYADYQPDTPAGTSVSIPAGTLRIKSRDYEIRDTQYLAALVAAAYPDLDRSAVAVTGGSYGGGESWVQASEPTWTFANSLDPALPVLQLQVAVPKYPWTDLGYSLTPHGHGGGPNRRDPYESSLGVPESPIGEGYPIGVAKASYISGLFASGLAKGVFELGTAPDLSPEGPVNIPSWNTRLVGGGDPYPDADPIVAQARRGLTEFRSAYYQDVRWRAQRDRRKVAVFSIQGWTDDLFEAVESFRQFKYLKRLNPRWPVQVAVADIGHSRSQNKPSQWARLNDQAYVWLQQNIGGSRDRATTVASQPLICGSGAAGEEITAATPERLATGALVVRYTGGKLLTNTSGAEDPDNVATDPIAGPFFDGPAPGAETGCTQSARTASTTTTGYTGLSQPLPAGRTYVGLGELVIPYRFAGTVGALNARVWNVPPAGAGPTQLVTRGTYRLEAPRYDAATGTLRLPFYGNHFAFAAGHRIRIDLQAVDTPTFRVNNLPFTLDFRTPTLVLPTRQGGITGLTGAGG